MSCQSGWAITGYNSYLKRFINTVVHNNSDNVILCTEPIIVVDVWEHAYFRDYCNDRQSYVLAMMRELNWNVIEKRIAKFDDFGKKI